MSAWPAPKATGEVPDDEAIAIQALEMIHFRAMAARTVNAWEMIHFVILSVGLFTRAKRACIVRLVSVRALPGEMGAEIMKSEPSRPRGVAVTLFASQQTDAQSPPTKNACHPRG